MSSRNLLNLALLLVLCILAAIVILEPGKEPAPVTTMLTQLKADDIKHIRINRSDKETIVLEKEQGQWWMREPYALPANDFRVKSVLRLVETESLSQHDLAQLDPAKFKLDQPTTSVTFNDDLHIDFGDNAPLEQRRYVRLGQQLHIITDFAYYQLIGSATDFLSHGVLPPDSALVKLELPGFTLALQEGQWTLEPEQSGISADAYTELLNQWRTAQALELRPGQNTGGKEIRIYLKDRATPLVFKALRTEDDFILSRADANLQFVLPLEKETQLLSLN